MDQIIKMCVLLIVGIFIFDGCKVVQPLGPKHPTKIVFGSFGGFAGSYKETVMLPDGSVYSKDKFNGDYQQMRNIEADQVYQLITILEDLEDQSYTIEDPGNMTYYIKLYRENENLFELSWGASNSKPSEVLKQLYKNLSTLCSEDTYVM